MLQKIVIVKIIQFSLTNNHRKDTQGISLGQQLQKGLAKKLNWSMERHQNGGKQQKSGKRKVNLLGGKKGDAQERKKTDLQCDRLFLPILALAAFSPSSAPNLLQSKIYEFNL